MKTRWRELLAGLWFVPGLVALGYIGLAVLLIAIDRNFGTGGLAFAFAGDAGAARSVLSTVAGSLITVAGLTFSLTIVVLTLISSQFTPRALRGFLGDRVTQVVAGAFVGVFAYCLLVLRSVRDDDPGPAFVPSLSVTVAIGLGLVSLGLLLLFIHHMGQSIQASHIVSRIGRETLAAIDRLHPDAYGRSDAGASGEPPAGPPARLIRPDRPGYLQSVAAEALSAAGGAGEHVQVPVRPGDFVTEETVIAIIRGSGRSTRTAPRP